MIDRFALSFLCIELDRNVRTGGTGLYILLTSGTLMEEARYNLCRTKTKTRPRLRNLPSNSTNLLLHLHDTCTAYVNPGANAAISTRGRSTWMMRTKRKASRRSMKLWMQTVLLIESECINQRSFLAFIIVF